MANLEQPDYIGPNIAPLPQQIREMQEYRQERELARAKHPTQPSLSEIMAVLQQLVAEVAQLRTVPSNS